MQPERCRARGAVSLGIGLVGLAYWGPDHLRVVKESEQTDLRWICDSDPDRALKLSRRTAAAATTDLDDVLADPRTDAVVLATPISTHDGVARRCLEAGKHVLVEKPFGGRSRSRRELIRLT